MCEFKVFGRDGGKRLTDEIVRSSLEDGRLVLYNILGSREVLEDSIVGDLNVSLERIDLFQLPGLGKLMKFLETYSKALESREYDDGLEVAWEELKGIWDERLGELRKLSGEK